jgi:hypothetical protein
VDESPGKKFSKSSLGAAAEAEAAPPTAEISKSEMGEWRTSFVSRNCATSLGFIWTELEQLFKKIVHSLGWHVDISSFGYLPFGFLFFLPSGNGASVVESPASLN